MTHLRGSIIKVKEVLKRGYDQPIVQQTRMEVVQETVPATSAQIFNIINIPGGTYVNGYLKKISITVDEFATVMQSMLRRETIITGDIEDLWRGQFIGNGEWSLFDRAIYDYENFYIVFWNNSVNPQNFTANISYIEV